MDYKNKYNKYHKKVKKIKILLQQTGGELSEISTDSSNLSSSSSSISSISHESKEECEKNIKKYENKNIVNTVFPFITTQDQLNNLITTSLTLVHSKNRDKYEAKYNIDKFNSLVYNNINNRSIEHTIRYIFDKMKTGVFVRISNNRLVDFIPLYNTNYRNDFSDKIKFKEGDIRRYLENKKKFNKWQARVNFDLSKWMATNCLLRNELDDKTPTQAYLTEFHDLLSTTLLKKKVNDCIFIINRKDFPYLNANYDEPYEHIYGYNVKMKSKYTENSFIPILSQSTTKDHADIPIPTGDDWHVITQKYFVTNLKECKNDYIFKNTVIPNWSDRKPVVFWRGQSTGCGNTLDTNPRLKVTKMAAELKVKGINYLDTGVVRFTLRDKKTKYNNYVEFFSNKDSLKPVNFVDRLEQLKYKFVLNIEGNSAAYRYGSLFKSGFCILNVESEYQMWFEPFLIEGKHYIKIKHDLSDLIEKIEWCLSHDEECEQIAKNGLEFYNQYFNVDFVTDYMSDVLNKISSILI